MTHHQKAAIYAIRSMREAIRRINVSPEADVVLWKEHGLYHARRTDWYGNPELWQVRRTLGQARKAVRQLRFA